MQVTIDLPDQLARRSERAKLDEIIERGLQQHGVGTSPHLREVIEFLASGPRPEEIVAFRPSEAHVDRSRELLFKNRESQLTESEEAEQDQMEHINHLMTLLKAEARKIRAAQRKSRASREFRHPCGILCDPERLVPAAVASKGK